MMDILMSETCWAHNKWNKIASDNKLVFHSSIMFVLSLDIKKNIYIKLVTQETSTVRHKRALATTRDISRQNFICFKTFSTDNSTQLHCSHDTLLTSVWTQPYKVTACAFLSVNTMKTGYIQRYRKSSQQFLMFVWPCILNMKWFVRPTWCNNYDLLINQ